VAPLWGNPYVLRGIFKKGTGRDLKRVRGRRKNKGVLVKKLEAGVFKKEEKKKKWSKKALFQERGGKLRGSRVTLSKKKRGIASKRGIFSKKKRGV